MKTNKAGIELIKSFEGYRGTAYRCPAGVWTIAFGHTNGVHQGMTCTREQGEEWLKQDLLSSETAVTAWNYLYKWNDNEFSALVSFTFNCGAGSLKNLLKSGNRNRAEIRKAILLYDKDINGKQLAGLTRRRKAELELFNTPTNTSAQNASQETQADYKTVDEIVAGIWRGEFGTPWSKSDKLYKFFLKKVNEYKGDK